MDLAVLLSPAELFGISALILNFIAYRQESANRYRVVSALALAALSIHFAIIGALAGSIVTGMAVIRNIIALRWQGPIVLWGFVLLNVVLAGYEFSIGTELLPLLAAYTSSIIFSVGSIRLNDPEQIRRWFIVAESLGLAYAIMVGSIEGIIFNLFNLGSIILKLLQNRRNQTLS